MILRTCLQIVLGVTLASGYMNAADDNKETSVQVMAAIFATFVLVLFAFVSRM